jgi:hypothetical protein
LWWQCWCHHWSFSSLNSLLFGPWAALPQYWFAPRQDWVWSCR